MRISDWSSDVCSSDLVRGRSARAGVCEARDLDRIADHLHRAGNGIVDVDDHVAGGGLRVVHRLADVVDRAGRYAGGVEHLHPVLGRRGPQDRLELGRSEEHTSELQSLMRISYAVFCLKKKKTD